MKDVDVLEPESEPETALVKWPTKPGIPRSEMFDPEDSWFDAPPEGFSLTVSRIDLTTLPYYFSIFYRVNNIAILFLHFLLMLIASRTLFDVHQLSTFATMWNALFEWIASSSLAYIYGRDESFHEEYLTVNGREYPRKIVLRDGRSSEIKETLAGCISRALPAIVTDLRLPIPISTLEQGMVLNLNP